MKNETLYDGITDIREEIVERSMNQPLKKKGTGRKKWFGAIAAVLALALVSGTLFWPDGNSPAASAYALAEAKYPDMSPYPDGTKFTNSETGRFDGDAYDAAYEAWREDVREQQNQPEDYADGLDGFFAASIRQVLSDSGTDNRAYSPLNVYMALGMLAELTDGNSRQQILNLLQAESIEALREQASSLWNANYSDDGATTSILASSLWLNENVDFVQSTMNTLAKTYYASSYQGEMGSEEFNEALRNWLNDQTGGLLNDQTKKLEMDPNTIMALASTIYFKAKWESSFPKRATAKDTFHAVSEDITCDFMYESEANSYYWGDDFSAVGKSLENSGNMWFILPDEGITTDELLCDEQVMEFILADGEWENRKLMTINLSVPKFDVVSECDLIPELKGLGITDVFDSETSDFSPMTRDTDDIYVSAAQHDARVMIDEEGCTAAAYTLMITRATGAWVTTDEIDFVVDRPFLFAITGTDGLPLFVGVVNQPV